MASPSLESYLSSVLDVTVIDTDVLHDGLNAMTTVTTADDTTYLLRHPNKLRDTTAFNDLATEYAILTTLADTPVPAPVPIHHCRDPSVIGEPFIVTTYRPGTTLQFGDPLPDRWAHPDHRDAIASQTVDTLATLHTLDPDRFEGVCPRKTPHDQVRLADDRLDHIEATTGQTYPRLRDVVEWLLDTTPPDGPPTPIHGDFRPGNLLYDDVPPTVTGVIDWETMFLGDPRTELGYLTFLWDDHPSHRPDPDPIDATYPDHDGVSAVHDLHEDGFHPWSTDPGAPSTADLVDAYTDATGHAFTTDRFYRALGAFLLATVWADLHRHATEHDDLTTWPPIIAYVARYADAITRGDVPLGP